GAFLLTFAGLFPIVNPLEGAPFFLGLTANLSAAERTVLARKAAVNGFALLLGSMALGPWLLEFFGIELPVVRIAGGLVVAALGWKLLTEEQWSDHTGSGLQGGPGKKVGSFFPLTMPLTVGPGSMSVAITIGRRKPARPPPPSPLARCSISRGALARRSGIMPHEAHLAQRRADGDASGSRLSRRRRACGRYHARGAACRLGFRHIQQALARVSQLMGEVVRHRA